MGRKTKGFTKFRFILILAVLIENLVYRPLSKKNVGQATTLIPSMGVYLLLDNLIALFMGNPDPGLGSSLSVENITIVAIPTLPCFNPDGSMKQTNKITN